MQQKRYQKTRRKISKRRSLKMRLIETNEKRKSLKKGGKKRAKKGQKMRKRPRQNCLKKKRRKMLHKMRLKEGSQK